MSADDFHRILGVKPGASAAEIKRAYRRQAMRWHPDRNADPDAHDQFKRIREAFERLSVGAELDKTGQFARNEGKKRGFSASSARQNRNLVAEVPTPVSAPGHRGCRQWIASRP